VYRTTPGLDVSAPLSCGQLRYLGRNSWFCPVFLPLHSLFGTIRAYGGMPLCSSIDSLRATTPTQAAGLHKHHDKKQHQAYPGSFHLFLLPLMHPHVIQAFHNHPDIALNEASMAGISLFETFGGVTVFCPGVYRSAPPESLPPGRSIEAEAVRTPWPAILSA
jgi:hypothetical protein